jgi:hypothetical protein
MSVLFRVIGLVNLVLSAVGLRFLLDSVISWQANPNTDPRQPYFYYAFYPMAAINLALTALLCLITFDLLRLRLAAVKQYTWFVLSVVVGYNVLVALFWTIPGRVGMSVAGASGVGNMGIAPFEFALSYVPEGYPVLSLVALLLARRSLARRSQVSS